MLNVIKEINTVNILCPYFSFPRLPYFFMWKKYNMVLDLYHKN